MGQQDSSGDKANRRTISQPSNAELGRHLNYAILHAWDLWSASHYVIVYNIYFYCSLCKQRDRWGKIGDLNRKWG